MMALDRRLFWFWRWWATPDYYEILVRSLAAARRLPMRQGPEQPGPSRRKSGAAKALRADSPVMTARRVIMATNRCGGTGGTARCGDLAGHWRTLGSHGPDK